MRHLDTSRGHNLWHSSSSWLQSHPLPSAGRDEQLRSGNWTSSRERTGRGYRGRFRHGASHVSVAPVCRWREGKGQKKDESSWSTCQEKNMLTSVPLLLVVVVVVLLHVSPLSSFDGESKNEGTKRKYGTERESEREREKVSERERESERKREKDRRFAISRQKNEWRK